MSSKGHKSHRRKPEAEAEERTPVLNEDGSPKLDDDGNPVYPDLPAEDPIDPKDTPEFKAYMASICQIAEGIKELTKAGCPAPDAGRICETVWCHQNGASIKESLHSE